MTMTDALAPRLLLTDIERLRFAEYLERDAASTDGIIEQMQRLGGPFEGLIREHKAEAAAQRIVAQMLRASHD